MDNTWTGVHTYPANTTVTIIWYHSPWHGLAYYDINGTIVSDWTGWGYNITMNTNYVLRAVYFTYQPLHISISPLNATVPLNRPATFLANISDGYYGATTTFYVNNTLAKALWFDNTPEWNFPSPQPKSPGGQIEWIFTPTSPGVYFIYAKAEDLWPYETRSKTAIITVKGPRCPAARFTGEPKESHQYGPVHFDASASSSGFDGDDECPISEYNWNFGDGYSGTGKTTTHIYATAGNYTVTLTVIAPSIQPHIDPQYVGTNMTSTTIQVKQVLPVGGYSSLVEGYTIARLLTTYLTTAALLASIVLVFRHKKQEHKHP